MVAATPLSVQADAVNHWPDGSVRWCEVRGYTAQSINPGGTDTLSLVRSAAPFTNTLPNGKTPAQLLSDLQSFGGGQDLNIELSSMASATGLTNNVYTSGTWTAHFNTLAAGPYLQQVNMGPCCMGFRAWGQLDNGAGQNHAHIHVTFYVWLWLDPSTERSEMSSISSGCIMVYMTDRPTEHCIRSTRSIDITTNRHSRMDRQSS